MVVIDGGQVERVESAIDTDEAYAALILDADHLDEEYRGVLRQEIARLDQFMMLALAVGDARLVVRADRVHVAGAGGGTGAGGGGPKVGGRGGTGADTERKGIAGVAVVAARGGGSVLRPWLSRKVEGKPLEKEVGTAGLE